MVSNPKRNEDPVEGSRETMERGLARRQDRDRKDDRTNSGRTTADQQTAEKPKVEDSKAR